MPTNVTVDYVKAQQKYLDAKTREEKIAALEEMLSTVPKHKGTENMQSNIKQKLAKLKRQTEAKTSRKILSIPKEGDAQVCILGLTQSGKSTLLSRLTNAKPEISAHTYTTTKPQVGTCDYGGVKVQLIEIPSSFKPVFMSIAQSSDGLILLYKNEKEKEDLKEILSKLKIKRQFIEINREEKPDEIKEKLWKTLGLIRIYCKEPGKKPEKKPLVLKKGSTVLDAASELHKDFIKYFKFARVWGKSAKHTGQSFGFDHKLEDGDIVEFHKKS